MKRVGIIGAGRFGLSLAEALAETGIEVLLIDRNNALVQNAIKKVMTRNGIKPAELRHCAVSEGKSAARNYDVVFCARTFVKTFEGIEANGTVLIPLKNVMSDKEIEAALQELDLLD